MILIPRSSNIWSPLGVMVITGNGLEIAEINFADPNAKFGKFSRDSRQYAKQILKLRQKLLYAFAGPPLVYASDAACCSGSSELEAIAEPQP